MPPPIPPSQQLSLDDYLAQHRWCNKHRRMDCRCGRKRRNVETEILLVMRYRASGRVAVSSEWIAIQLLIEYGIERAGSSIRYDLQRMCGAGMVIKSGSKGEYQVAH